MIGENTDNANSFVGPYTSIGNGSKICNSNIEYCVVLGLRSISDIERLEDSLIGKNPKVSRNPRNRTIKLHVRITGSSKYKSQIGESINILNSI